MDEFLVPERSRPVSSRQGAFLCAGLVALAILCSYPMAEIGICDDWSYIRSAQLMARSGHFQYVGWASAMLGWILPWADGFIKVFGFSFTAVRSSVMVLAAVTAYLLQRCFARSGLNAWNATLGTLTCVLSPVYLPAATTFMTDLPGMLVAVLCLYCCLRGLQSTIDRRSAFWLGSACVLTAVGGTARQTAWLALYIMVPCAAWLLRRRRLPWLLLAACWLVCCLFTEFCLRWFSHQPYSLGESLVAGYFDRNLLLVFFSHLFRAFLKAGFLLLPVMAAFVPLFPRIRVRWTWFAAAVGGSALLYLAEWHLGRATTWLAPFDGNFFTERGLVDMPQIGTAPVLLHTPVRVMLTVLSVAACVACVAVLSGGLRQVGRRDKTSGEQLRQMAVLQVPYVAVYLLLVLHRALFSHFFDRYWLAVLFVPTILLLLWYQQSVAERLPAVTVILLVCTGLFSVAANHDLFAQERARVRAAQELQDAGVPRTAFYGGWEFDGWTQVNVYGFANSGMMNTPHGLAVNPPIPLPWKSKPCDYWAAHMAAAVHPRYAVSFDDHSCAGPSRFSAVSYRQWLPPFHGTLYIEKVTSPPLQGR